MSIELFLYLAGVLGNIKGFLSAVCVLSVIGLIVYIMFFGIEHEKFRINKTLLISAVIFSLLSTLTPDKTTLYTIGGVYYAKQMINSDSPITQKSLKILENELDEILERQLKGNK